MKIIFDNDATIVDYHKFIEKYAIPYFRRKYGMEVVNINSLEIEDVFDMKNTLIKKGYSQKDAEIESKRIIEKFWVGFRYIIYSLPGMFYKDAAKTLKKLKKQGHRIEIHSSRLKADNRGLIGKLTRALMYLQYWLNGCFISCKCFYCYQDDTLKAEGVIKRYPDIVFEDKPEMCEQLITEKIKCVCVSGKHNREVREGKYVKRLNSYKWIEVEETITSLIGTKKWNLYKEIAKSDVFYKRVLFIRQGIKKSFKPIVLNANRLKKIEDRGVIYASNHRSTLDPIIITAIINEPIRYAALARFFRGEDSIFNNSKNILLRKITAFGFKKLKFFSVERIRDDVNANNNNSIKEMIECSNIKCKIGIFPEGTTLKNTENDFGEFNDSFIRLAALTNAIIQPITIYWFTHKGKRKCIVNFGSQLEVRKDNMNEVFSIFMKCQQEQLQENRNKASEYTMR
ncbi:MAG: 1-acyl-sn-glycerol-3-phosphate acyltransferase [Lachnospiraceae bacterium]|nr:1-acyl-sn-glycerol-3-phosphate acyltransferase [Lachnospiraceae bacterium]